MSRTKAFTLNREVPAFEKTKQNKAKLPIYLKENIVLLETEVVVETIF